MKWAAPKVILGTLFAISAFCQNPKPIGFSIPETKIIQEIPNKERDFAFITPLDIGTYIYTAESDYYRDYQKSYYAVTCRKGGWDCLRHYEILANGCIPYFLDLEQSPPDTMKLLPKELILEAMRLDGVSYLQIDHSKFDPAKYYELLNRILVYTREHLTSRNMANYILKELNYTGKGKVLFLTNDPSPDYLRCITLIGLKQVLGDRLVDVPKIEHIYKSYPHNVQELYGKGFTYTKIVDDLPMNRDNIEQRIRNREFDLIIYGSVHRGLLYHTTVRQFYRPHQIAYLCGEDIHRCSYRGYPNLFLREFH